MTPAADDLTLQARFHADLYQTVLDENHRPLQLPTVKAIEHMGHLAELGCGWLIEQMADAHQRQTINLIEFGSGFGATIRQVSQGLRQKGVDIRRAVAVDLIVEHCQVARRSLSELESHVVVCANAEALPFSDASMDAAFCAGSVSHFRNFRGIAAEARRVLMPDGSFHVLDEIGIVADGVQLSTAFRRWHPPDVFFFSDLASRLADLNDAGFTDVVATSLETSVGRIARKRRLAVQLLRPQLDEHLGFQQAAHIVKSVKATMDEYVRGAVVPYLFRASRM